jgi:methanogenic corrinoid protein MtbC1
MNLETIYEAVIDGDADAAKAETQAAIDEKFVPEMLIAARAMQGALEILKPLLVEGGEQTISKTRDALTTANVRDQVKVIIGGAPITKKFADEVGADGFAHRCW